MRVYLNWKGPDGRETVDEFDSRKEAREMVSEYQMAGMSVYMSTRPCANWITEREPQMKHKRSGCT